MNRLFERKTLAGMLLLNLWVLMAACGGPASGEKDTRVPATVTVTRGDVQETVVAPGRVVGSREVMLAMPVGGQLDAIHVRQGSVVRRGEGLADLDAAPLVRALEDARADQIRRLQVGRGPFPTREVIKAEANLDASTLLAPFDGVVLDISARPGDSVGAGVGFILFADPAAVEVRTTVIEEDLPLVKPGQPVEVFFDARPDAIVTGTVARIVPRRIPDQTRPLFHVYITLEETPDGIVPGMTADAEVMVERAVDVLRLPRAVVRGPAYSTARVTVWASGRREQRSIRVGLRGDVNVEIIEGLREGEKVVAE